MAVALCRLAVIDHAREGVDVEPRNVEQGTMGGGMKLGVWSVGIINVVQVAGENILLLDW